MRRLLVVAFTTMALAGCSGLPWGGESETTTQGSPSSAPTPVETRNITQLENEKKGDGRWRIKEFAPGEVEGYASATSVLPGEDFDLFVSSSIGDVKVEAHRIGYYGGMNGRNVWRAEQPVKGVKQAAAAVGKQGEVYAPWKKSLTVHTSDWPEGTYVLTLKVGTKGTWVPITVRSADPKGRLVLLNAAATWQAYNKWGGASTYIGPGSDFGKRARAVSFDRPYDGNGAPKLMTHEQRAIIYLDSLGLDLAYTTSVDLDKDPASVAGAAGVVSLGHDEYWSRAMRANVEAARDAGTNLAFLGANAVYWRVRFPDDSRRVMVATKSAAEDPDGGEDATDLWRRPPASDPENSLVGMLYECYPTQGAMVITDPGFFLFQGAEEVAAEPITGLVGVEVDRVYPIEGTPENLQVVADSPLTCERAAQPATRSNVTYYTTKSGAGVFSTGTMLWTSALSGPSERLGVGQSATDFTRIVTKNLAKAMIAGPMGAEHPAQGNVAEFDFSESTRTGTGFEVVP